MLSTIEMDTVPLYYSPMIVPKLGPLNLFLDLKTLKFDRATKLISL